MTIEQSASRKKLGIAGLTPRTPVANSNATPAQDAQACLAAMTENATRNKIMITQMIKPHLSRETLASDDRVSAIVSHIAAIALQAGLDAPGIINLAKWTEWFTQPQRQAMRKAA